MEKSKTTDKLKHEYEKVYENPLDWCPLYGYLPEIKKADFINNPKIYSIASRCSELIQDTRDYFFDADCMQKYISLPDIETLPYPHNNYKDEYSKTRLLFQNLDYLTLKMLSKVRGCHDIFSNKQSIPDKPIGRTSNRWSNSLSVFAGSVNLNDSPVTINYLLDEAQKITKKELNYNYDAKQLYALYIILESWLILTSLFFNPDRTNSKDVLDDINDRIFYIYDLRATAMSYSNRWEHEPDLKEKEEIKKIAQPYRKQQSKYAKKGVEKRIKRNVPNHKKWESEARKICEKIFKTRNARKNLTYRNIAREIMKSLSLAKGFITIQRDKGVKDIVNDYKQKITS